MSKHSSGYSLVVKRYAEALFSSAGSKKNVDQLTKDVMAFASALAESKELSRALKSPVISANDKLNALLKIADNLKAGELFKNFLKVLAQNGRLDLLAPICHESIKIVQSLNGEQEVVVTSTVQLTKKDMDQIAKVVSKGTGQKVAVSNEIDESILGGLKIRIGSVMVDDSVKTHLSKLERRLRSKDIFETHLTQNLKEVG